MPDYKKMYLTMFNKVTDVIEELQALQQQVEQIYIESDTGGAKLTALPKGGGKESKRDK